MTPTTTMISSQELAVAAGVSYRQLDYWVRQGLITPTVDSHGSGSRRAWDPELIPRVKLLGTVSRLLNDTMLFEKVVNAYESGQIERDGVTLQWQVA